MTRRRGNLFVVLILLWVVAMGYFLLFRPWKPSSPTHANDRLVTFPGRSDFSQSLNLADRASARAGRDDDGFGAQWRVPKRPREEDLNQAKKMNEIRVPESSNSGKESTNQAGKMDENRVPERANSGKDSTNQAGKMDENLVPKSKANGSENVKQDSNSLAKASQGIEKDGTNPGQRREQGKAEEGNVLVHDNQDLVKAASAIAAREGVVLFTMVNDAFFDMTSSWLCNTAPLPGIHRKVLFLTTDVTTGQRLKRGWPEVTVVSMNVTSFSGTQEYSKAGYVRLMVERTRCIQRLVQARVPLLLFEVDFTWLGDPLPEVLSHKDYDVTGVEVYGTNRHVICGCFLLLNPTPATGKVWDKLTALMEGLYKKVANSDKFSQVSEGTNDQTYLSSLLNKHHAGVKTFFLSDKLFPEGKWYMKETVRKDSPHPLVIHNNWIIGKDKKIARAKQFGHWFLSRDSTISDVRCNVTAVNDVLAQGPRTQV